MEMVTELEDQAFSTLASTLATRASLIRSQ